MTYKASRRSFLGAALISLSPAALAGTMVLLLGSQMSPPFLVLSGLMVLFSIYLLVQDVFVHLQCVEIDEAWVRVVSPLSTLEMRWSDVETAVIRERANAVSRTDRLLLLESATTKLAFNTSTLGPDDEESLLAQVRSRVRLVVYRDSPSV